MIQIHYDNVRTNDKRLDHRDHSGIRFYLSDELRQYDLGYLTLGTESNPGAIRFLRTSIILLSMHFVRAKRLKVQKKKDEQQLFLSLFIMVEISRRRYYHLFCVSTHPFTRFDGLKMQKTELVIRGFFSFRNQHLVEIHSTKQND